ncbi:extracellularly regulated kinase 7 [Haematobia irritans]|uniref:extracellularly regulated kinase 7 n=1 Tax=Haematobia irritans TaxID=7368 RepID=UPI003F508B73
MTTKSKQDKHKMSEIDENISKIFDIKKRLGKGAYGIVWKALDKRNNETVAVKKIFDAFRDETDAQRTFREIVFLKAFRHHPNIVRLHNVYKASNNLDIYLIFEYMESDLHNIIKKGTILKDIHKRYVMYQLINAIKYIHSGNVIHRDLKPSNVLIDSKCRCKLADFGLARSVSQWPMRSDSNDMSCGDAPQEPLLTDYVATRWYRAPEILVASKRYTKGIDMWSLGCILGEMIRGKPLFQGSSTVNQIEKIVSTLPDITEEDIRSVGAGFGSVLLKKQISKEKKIGFSDLLNDASKDALDLVKSLLVLDPLGRLTAKQALNHPYVEKFRNSIPEIELNVDILPPFRDDVRLSVPEYRSKLYEIVQVSSSEKKQIELTSKLGDTVFKQRIENKPQVNTQEKSEGKKLAKVKHNSRKMETEEKYKLNDKETEKKDDSNNNFSKKSLTKIVSTPNTPVVKRKQGKLGNNLVASSDDVGEKQTASNVLEDRLIQRTKAQGQQYHQSKPSLLNIVNEFPAQHGKRHSLSNSNTIGHSLNSSYKGLLTTNSHRLHRSSTALNKLDNEISNNKTSDPTTSNTTSSSSPILRQAKSLTYYSNKSPGSEKSTKPQDERFCYERRLKRLEDEIERYKNEVKNFCRDTFSHTKQMDKTKANDEIFNNQHDREMEKQHNLKIMPSKMKYPDTPIKNSYIQLLAKTKQSKHSDALKPETSTSGSCDRLIQMVDNSKSFSSRSKDTKKYVNNKYNGQRLCQQEAKVYKEQSISLQKHGSRAFSKFI